MENYNNDDKYNNDSYQTYLGVCVWIWNGSDIWVHGVDGDFSGDIDIQGI